MIIFVEDEFQKDKILKNIRPKRNTLVIFYHGLLLKKILFLDITFNKLPIRSNFIEIIMSIKKADAIYTEFANFIPRFFSFIFSKKLVATVFGYLVESNIGNNVIFSKLFRSQLADEYWIFGKKNKTHEIKPFLETLAKVKVYDRLDIPDLSNYKTSNYILIIGQSWVEEKLYFYEEAENKLIEFINEKKIKMVYCKHPRSKKNLSNFTQLNGYKECLNYIKKNGRPILACSLCSSMIHELEEMGVCSVALVKGDHLSENIEPDFSMLENYDI